MARMGVVRRWVAHLCCWDGVGHKHPPHREGQRAWSSRRNLQKTGWGRETAKEVGIKGTDSRRADQEKLWLRRILLTIRSRPGSNYKTLYWEYRFFSTWEKSRNGSARQQGWQTGPVLFVIGCRRCHVAILKVYLLLAFFFFQVSLKHYLGGLNLPASSLL